VTAQLYRGRSGGSSRRAAAAKARRARSGSHPGALRLAPGVDRPRAAKPLPARAVCAVLAGAGYAPRGLAGAGVVGCTDVECATTERASERVAAGPNTGPSRHRFTAPSAPPECHAHSPPSLACRRRQENAPVTPAQVELGRRHLSELLELAPAVTVILALGKACRAAARCGHRRQWPCGQKALLGHRSALALCPASWCSRRETASFPVLR
jgi:hypothetical protein